MQGGVSISGSLMPNFLSRSMGMNTPHIISDSELVRDCLATKLHPSRHPKMPAVLAAIVGFVIGAPFGNPRIVEMTVTPDRLVIARPEGAVSPVVIAPYEQLLFAWLLLLDAARLTKAERMAAECSFAEKIGYLGRADA
jgi:hypothetical protein